MVRKLYLFTVKVEACDSKDVSVEGALLSMRLLHVPDADFVADTAAGHELVLVELNAVDAKVLLKECVVVEAPVENKLKCAKKTAQIHPPFLVKK